MPKPTPELPLSPRRPAEVAEALRERTHKTDDAAARAYMLLAAETIDHLIATTRPKKRT